MSKFGPFLSYYVVVTEIMRGVHFMLGGVHSGHKQNKTSTMRFVLAEEKWKKKICLQQIPRMRQISCFRGRTHWTELPTVYLSSDLFFFMGKMVLHNYNECLWFHNKTTLFNTFTIHYRHTYMATYSWNWIGTHPLPATW